MSVVSQIFNRIPNIKSALRKIGPDVLLIATLPIVLLIINSNWIFTPTPFVLNNRLVNPDPSFYFSYFRHFFDLVGQYPSNSHYFVERLSWNLPGYAAYHLFPPIAANLVLHLSIYYIGVFSIYGIVYFLFNQQTALLTALLMGGYTWFFRATGWDYVDGIGVAYFSVLLLLLTLAAFKK